MSAFSVIRDRRRTGARGDESRIQAPTEPSASLAAERDRLTTRFTILQCELGGLFYEMAIRDHVRMDVLMPKAAALQRLDLELADVEERLGELRHPPGGHCVACGSAHPTGAAFCSHCGSPLAA